MHFLTISKEKAIWAGCVIAFLTASSDFWEVFDVSNSTPVSSSSAYKSGTVGALRVNDIQSSWQKQVVHTSLRLEMGLNSRMIVPQWIPMIGAHQGTPNTDNIWVLSPPCSGSVNTTMAGLRLVATPLIWMAIAFEARILRLSYKMIYNVLYNVLYITWVIMYRCPQDCVCQVAPQPYNPSPLDSPVEDFDFNTDMDLTAGGLL